MDLGAERTGKRASRKHHWSSPTRAIPSKPPQRESPFGFAIRLLYPGPDYPGRLRSSFALFNRASREAIRAWRTGRNNPPQWARQLLIETLRRKANALWQAADALEKKNPGR